MTTIIKDFLKKNWPLSCFNTACFYINTIYNFQPGKWAELESKQLILLYTIGGDSGTGIAKSNLLFLPVLLANFSNALKVLVAFVMRINAAHSTKCNQITQYLQYWKIADVELFSKTRVTNKMCWKNLVS